MGEGAVNLCQISISISLSFNQYSLLTYYTKKFIVQMKLKL